jgi:hypothetical protein
VKIQQTCKFALDRFGWSRSEFRNRKGIVRLSRFAFSAVRFFQLSFAKLRLRLNLVHVTCDMTSSYAIHFKGAANFGEAHLLTCLDTGVS